MKQKFRFAELYRKNRTAVEKTLSAMWCGEARNESQKGYISQLTKLIPEVFAPKDAMPLVQCMNNYEAVYPEHEAEAEEMLGTLWKKTLPPRETYKPYEHQYQCWKTLLKGKTPDGMNMSIVVTTGTGSGKTECFMLPLVQDLIDNFVPEEVQAIFLYPLNALMEDQKVRMEKLLEGTELKFAVYNGDMPQCIPSPEDPSYKKVMRKVDAIRGITRDEQGNITETKFKHVIATREELRQHPANILLTNPTMLEYILLREKDRNLIKEEKKTLRWIALDETHTYTGAGAAEIAMLIRRVLMAYGVTTNDVRFATSSATIGKSGDEKAKEELREFIANITGLQVNQVRFVDGKRKGQDALPEKDKGYWMRLMNENKDGYLRLDELITEGESVEEKLERLDAMCQTAEDQGLEDLRVKVHYFYRVPNHGLFVDISDPHYKEDGSFKIYTENMPDDTPGTAPLLEMSRCKHCGEYVAIAEEVKLDDGIAFSPITMDDSDMFDLDSTEETGKTYYIFGTSNSDDTGFDNNAPYIIKGNRMLNVTAGNPAGPGWHVIANTQCQCPYCGTKLTKQAKPDEENPDQTIQDEEDSKKLQKFRIASDFVSRLIAPSTLDLMTEAKPKDEKKVSLHKGQQFISFVDSRQSAAQSTIKQNLEEERLWVYGTIFHELCRMATAGTMTLDEAKKYYEGVFNTATSRAERRAADDMLEILEGNDQEAINKILADLKPNNFLSWQDILDVLLNDRLADTFCQQFAERSELSPELDDDGNIRPETKRKYILAIMVQYLSKRPLTAAAPETMGLFTSYFVQLKDALTSKLPDAVELFNGKLDDENRITKKDWHGLMQIFLDYTVRSNESVFLKMDDLDPMDIFQCVRFATQKERRRPVHKPTVREKGPNRSRIIRLLAKLIANDKHITINNAISGYKQQIQDVIDCMWNELTLKYELLEHSTHYDDELRQHVKDKDEIVNDIHLTPYRLNLAKIGFKLYDDVYLCDTNASSDNHHVEWLRPIETPFHGYSPYTVGGEPMPLKEELHETWEAFPYHNFSATPNPTDEVIEGWAKENRKILWNNDLWGETGTFAERLLQIHQFPELFIQAEHTAQVDKMVSRQVQEDFKDHCINILACSTTMEMGVDLGDLELVMMTSVPPMPSNYKQRAGRSGRRGQVRSACVTLCGSDAVGIRTLLNPMENVILRTTSTPTVDLNSAQVVQRHVNSFLIREFGVFGMAGGSVNEQVISYYTNYEIVPDGESSHFKIKRKVDHSPVSPLDGLGDETGTPYETFNNKCSEALDDKLRRKLRILLNGTIFSSRPPQYVVAKAREMNENCYAELELRIQDYAKPYKEAKSAKQQAFFEMKYIEPLAARLLAYWATHRFTPNANMPVNVIEFDINSASQNTYSLVTVSNPSYPLRTALSQYAPGNPIARDGTVRIVRGIRYTNFFKPEVTFKKLYFNREQVVIDTKDELENLEKWKVSASTELDLLQPAEFIPDMNESANRILDQNVYTRVSAQLIGADEWKQDRIEPHLFDSRSSRESGNGQILYYNEGTGFGYCHCTKCGKTVLENWPAAASSDPEKMPAEMNNIPSKDAEKENFHFSLIRKGTKPNRCMGCNSTDYIKRNVVLGDTIQTDYTEIRIRHFQKDWINGRNEEENLLITLGLLFARGLAEELNVERTDLDFTITPNGHICIFDANPGGSGYSNQLAAMDLLKSVIERSRLIIEAAEQSGNKEALIDKFTLHYVNRIDIQAAKAWIEEERAARKVLPDPVKNVFGDTVTETSLAKMQRAFITSQNEAVLFVDDDYDHWEYEGTDHCWRGQFLNHFAPHGQQTSFCVAECSDNRMTEPIRDMIRSIKGWANEVLHIKNPFAGNGLFPLAYIDGRLYFTNNPNHITLNDKWGNGTIYYIRTNNFAATADFIDTSVEESTTKIFKLTDGDPTNIKTSELGRLIRSKSGHIVDAFIDHCKANNEETIKVSYQDEHMKSILSMILTLQTAGYFIKEIGNTFTMEFKLERYDSDSGKWDSMTANLPSSYSKQITTSEKKIGRDEWLESLANSWQEDLDYEDQIDGTILPICSLPKNTLTHWRVLSFECAGKRLSIYPDGGLMNGWSIYNAPGRSRRYDTATITYDTEIDLYRNQEIKFDVTIEDI
ncbi:MAG: Distinct helicase family with a unique C-terminal domain including a metal-binding cysteine cluster [bacterium P3]|nr:MAG: Distinct helicase family with a unique C-terminal domain including a metal-binding cysteine cluster [bacterium P3]KWW40327.1 MAG: Distinct helicase family with a unique C-terminal domain including a metal-binding cysteine cluster [bacterium F083]